MSEQTLSKPAHRPASVPIKRIALGAIAGSERYLLVHEFGSQDAPLHIYMQAGLHADEAPGSVVLYQLADQLAQLESEGQVQARITLLPAANPIGATQYLTGGLHCGRFDLATGINFNRRFPDLRPAVREALGQIPAADRHDAIALKHWLRKHLQNSLTHWPCASELDRWRVALMKLACTADWVLDLHCDQEAVTHLYTAPEIWPDFRSLAGHLASEVQLLDSTASEPDGHGAFDTACFQPWLTLKNELGQNSELACRSATIELRGQTDVSEAFAQRDVSALIAWLRDIGALSDDFSVDAEPARHTVSEPRPLVGVESIYAPNAGIFVPSVELGSNVCIGQTLGKLYDLQAHQTHHLQSQHGGIVFARTQSRVVRQGAELIKIAGAHATRNGSLLSQ